MQSATDPSADVLWEVDETIAGTDRRGNRRVEGGGMLPLPPEVHGGDREREQIGWEGQEARTACSYARLPFMITAIVTSFSRPVRFASTLSTNSNSPFFSSRIATSAGAPGRRVPRSLNAFTFAAACAVTHATA